MRFLGLVYAKLAADFYSERIKSVLKGLEGSEDGFLHHLTSNKRKELIAEALVRVLKSHVRAALREADGESNQLDVTKGAFVFAFFFGFAVSLAL